MSRPAYANALLDRKLDIPADELHETARVMIANYELTEEFDSGLRTLIGTLDMMGNRFSVLRPVTDRLRTAFQLLADTIPTRFAWADDAEALLAADGVE